jgi:hypothetical protein
MNASRLRSTVLLTTMLAVAAGVVGHRLVTLHARATISAAVPTAPTGTAAQATPPAQAARATTTTLDAAPRTPLAPSSAPSTIAAPKTPDVATSTPPPQQPPASAPAPAERTSPQAVAVDNGFGCRAALAYLAAHQAPGFIDICRPHAASGGYGFTCVDHWPQCPGRRVIAIACPAPIVYQNEASNSLVLSGLSRAPIDPYGQYDRRCPPYA